MEPGCGLATPGKNVSSPLHNTEVYQIYNKLCNHDIIINKICLISYIFNRRSQIQITINQKAHIHIKQAINEFAKSCLSNTL